MGSEMCIRDRGVFGAVMEGRTVLDRVLRGDIALYDNFDNF